MWTNPQGCWTDQWQRRVCGLTECWSGSLQVEGQATPTHSTLTHELAHVVQRCSPRGPQEPTEDVDHAGWTRAGIYAAVAATREP